MSRHTPIKPAHPSPPRSKLALKDLRVFIVEDDPLIALDVAMSLQDAGATCFGPYPTCRGALAALPALLETSGIDLAVLDVELGRETSEPIARALSKAGIPILFHTGLDWRNGCAFPGIEASVLHKPSSPERLIEFAAVHR